MSCENADFDNTMVSKLLLKLNEQKSLTVVDNYLWENAIKSNEIDQFRRYQKLFPNGVHSNELLDVFDYIRAEQQHTISAYQTYAKKHPNGRYLKNANQNMDNLSIVFKNGIMFVKERCE